MEDTKKITTTERSEESTRWVTPGYPYFIIKNFYKHQYHASSTKQCFILSILIFILLITITLPIRYSIITSVYVGLGVAYISYCTNEIVDRFWIVQR